jgi:oligoendopeptidase F
MSVEVRERSQIPKQFTWNSESVFAAPADWDAQFNSLGDELKELSAYQGRLGEGPATLLEALELFQTLIVKAYKLYMYAVVDHSVDTRRPEATQRQGRGEGAVAQALGASAFLRPELLSIGEAQLRDWIRQEPRLAIYQHYFDNLFRLQTHVRSMEVEELLGRVQDPFRAVFTTHTALVDSDFQFRPAVSSDGREQSVNQGSLDTLLRSPDRELRRTAWESYADTYLTFKNTLANSLGASLRQNVFVTRARKYASSLEMALFNDNIPEAVFHNLLETFRNNVGTWHRYWRVRRAALGVEELHPYDVWAPITNAPPAINFQQAVDWIREGLRPLGDEYADRIRQGCLEDRWVDVYPNLGKRQGAFSFGVPGTHPFILMSFADDVSGLSTLAHELGHSMHSYLTWKNQPVIYAEYSLFVAEVASNFHQAMVRAHLLENSSDTQLQIAIIEEAMDNFHRYFLIMPTLARFELETHRRVERGEGLSADGMVELMADLFAEPFGTEMQLDRARVGITWAQFQHLYRDYYVYQYATGISGAHSLARRILQGEAGAAQAYLEFLKTGGSRYPLDALRLAGVDLLSPEPVEQTFRVLDDLVDRLAKLTGVSEAVAAA